MGKMRDRGANQANLKGWISRLNMHRVSQAIGEVEDLKNYTACLIKFISRLNTDLPGEFLTLK